MIGAGISLSRPQVSYGVSEAALVAALFGSSEDGALYNPADFTSLFQSRAGEDQADAIGDVVGLMLDKSQMGGLTAAEFIAAQPNIATNGTFDTDSDWSKNGSPAPTISGGTASFTGLSNSFALTQNMGLQADTYYYIEFEVLNYVAGQIAVKLNGGSNPASSNKTANGTYSCILTNPSADGVLAFICSGLFEGDLDNVVVKAIPGNHAVAPSDAARPVLASTPKAGYSPDGPELVDSAGDISKWTAFGTNTLAEPVTDEIEITFVDHLQGAYINLNDDGIMTADPVGNSWYALTLEAKVSSGDSVALYLYDGGDAAEAPAAVTSTSYEERTILFQPAAGDPDGGYFSASLMSAGEVITIRNVSIRKIADSSLLYYLSFDGVDDRMNFADWGSVDASIMGVAVNSNSSSGGYSSVISTTRQIIYANINAAAVWGSYNQTNLESSVDVRTQEAVLLLNTRDYDDVDLYTNAGDAENVTDGTGFDVRPPGIGFVTGQARALHYYGSIHRAGAATAAQVEITRKWLNQHSEAY